MRRRIGHAPPVEATSYAIQYRRAGVRRWRVVLQTEYMDGTVTEIQRGLFLTWRGARRYLLAQEWCDVDETRAPK